MDNGPSEVNYCRNPEVVKYYPWGVKDHECDAMDINFDLYGNHYSVFWTLGNQEYRTLLEMLCHPGLTDAKALKIRINNALVINGIPVYDDFIQESALWKDSKPEDDLQIGMINFWRYHYG